MKYLITFVFLFYFAPAIGQSYYPLLRNNVSWDVFEYEVGPICNLKSASRYFISGDTSINSIDYKIIKYHPIVSLLPQPSPFCWPFAVDGDSTNLANYFMREDTSQQKVYIYNHWNNQEDLLYDFSLFAGDTIFSNYSGAGSPFVIDSIGNYQMPNGTSRRIFYGKVPWWSTEFYIEGVGSSTGLFHPFAWAIGAGTRLSCVLENGSSIYSDSILAFGCLGYVGMEELSSLIQIDASPNPAHNILNIMVTKGEKGIFRLLESSGREVFKTEIVNEKTQIDITSFRSGIYFYRFELNDYKYLAGKILLQN